MKPRQFRNESVLVDEAKAYAMRHAPKRRDESKGEYRRRISFGSIAKAFATPDGRTPTPQAVYYAVQRRAADLAQAPDGELPPLPTRREWNQNRIRDLNRQHQQAKADASNSAA